MIVDGDRIVADKETHPAGKPHACQGGDKGLDLQLDDESAHDCAQGHPHDQHEQDDQPRDSSPRASNTAEATVVRATTPLTERSMPPVRITNVIPMPLISR